MTQRREADGGPVGLTKAGAAPELVRLQHRKVFAELEGGDLGAVLLPLLALVAQELTTAPGHLRRPLGDQLRGELTCQLWGSSVIAGRPRTAHRRPREPWHTEAMTTTPLRTALEDIQRMMLIKFNGITSEIEHKGLRGRAREAMIIRDYLGAYLPAKVRPVQSAEIVDSEGGRSPECDIVIQDMSTPPLHQSDATAIIPVEWAHGIIEAKSTLSLPELRDSQAKIAKAKGLKKLTYVKQSGDIEWGIDAYGRRFNHFPMHGAVFSYSSKSPLPNLARELNKLQADLPMELWVDMVIVLDRGLLMYRRPDGTMLIRPEPQSALCAIKSSNPLMPATLAIQDVFSGVWMPQTKLGAYLGSEPWGEIISI